ncbi:hypothetical protein M426DRAFT_24290 [Hypoxylon sp. CI-4A]|nr:hypothetical protein M426DRAFT_24290 [Hypoxylon sp. CI-4A]
MTKPGDSKESKPKRKYSRESTLARRGEGRLGTLAPGDVNKTRNWRGALDKSDDRNPPVTEPPDQDEPKSEEDRPKETIDVQSNEAGKVQPDATDVNGTSDDGAEEEIASLITARVSKSLSPATSSRSSSESRR